MHIHPIQLELDLTFNKAPRSPGLHMSDIYGSLYHDLEPKRYGGKFTAAESTAYQVAGLALEEMLEEGLANRLADAGGGRPGEFVDPDHGIIFSPDLLIFNGSTRLGEIKLTWMSSREVPREPGESGFPPKFDKYFTQMKAYCRCLDITESRLIAYFVNGNYDRRNGMKPELLAWDIEFTKRELEENWRMLINHARHKGMLI